MWVLHLACITVTDYVLEGVKIIFKASDATFDKVVGIPIVDDGRYVGTSGGMFAVSAYLCHTSITGTKEGD